MIVPIFKLLRQVADENFDSHHIEVRDRKRDKIENEGKNKSQHLSFVFSNTLGRPHRVYKI